ncbi:excinuclease ABC subunit UvrC [Propionicicella superfundia]|uniref:excinuclease ABC subunit UvrC n=1 Tax=Propionicicella superfundia TaxID=348582 RepID=UPI0003F5F143|nr:excinuclease ABC subunit UvrC [Propionicicella superfundia]
MAGTVSWRPRNIPAEPGVYRFSDERGQVIYVGKAKSLRSRLGSYFAAPRTLLPRTATMVATARDVEWTVVRNELEALQLEYTWIKQYEPRFNIKYRDDKSYPWLAITWDDEYPRVFVGRGAKRKGTRYFGPFSLAWAVRETVNTLLSAFPMRSCSNGVFRNAVSSGRPCLLGHIGKCAAPCVARVTAEEHREIVGDFIGFWTGHGRELERKLTADMERASASTQYELAAARRDQLRALRAATERNAIVLPDGTDVDVVAMVLDPLEVAVQVFQVRDGRVRAERGQVADRTDDADVAELLPQFLVGLYADVEEAGIPREILVQEPPDDAEVLAELLTEIRGAKVRVRVPQRGPKRDLLDTVTRNATETLAQHKTKRAADLTTRSRALDELQAALGLDTPPLRIECFDISHLQGTEPVASMVVFEDGLPQKAEYRRFLIRSTDGNDDVGAMHEVITRRLRRLLDDREALRTATEKHRFHYEPSLLVVDGGAPQVAAAEQARAELGVEAISVVGLAKRLEEVWVPGEEYPVILPRTSEGLYLLQRVRDEAHRFAITHHRARRSRSMVESVLDDVPGLGEVRRKALLSRFGSLRKLRAASEDELASVPGIGGVTAAAITQTLAARAPTEGVNVTTGEVVESP